MAMSISYISRSGLRCGRIASSMPPPLPFPVSFSLFLPFPLTGLCIMYSLGINSCWALSRFHLLQIAMILGEFAFESVPLCPSRAYFAIFFSDLATLVCFICTTVIHFNAHARFIHCWRRLRNESEGGWEACVH